MAMPFMSSVGSTWKQEFLFDRRGQPKARGYRTECARPKFTSVMGAHGFQKTVLPCRKCKHCRWVKSSGRANAAAMEIATSDWCAWVTFTFRPGESLTLPDGTVVDLTRTLCKEVMQRFHKRVRINIERQKGTFAGVKTTGWRYLQCGERGKKRGRPHFHALIFGKGQPPDWLCRDGKFLDVFEWGHGHVDVRAKATTRDIWYALKYMHKDKGTWYSQSSGSAIGAEYARKKAVEIAVAGMPVPTLDFSLTMPIDAYRRPVGTKRAHLNAVNNRKAPLLGAKRRHMLEAFADAKGRPLLSIYRTASPALRGELIKAERRRRELREGVKPEHVFARDRIKLAVWNEARAMLGEAPLRSLNQSPARPAGWKPDYGRHGAQAPPARS